MGEQTATARAVARVPPRSGTWSRAAKRLLPGPVRPTTWRALGNLLAWAAASALFAAALLCCLAVGLAWVAAVLLRLPTRVAAELPCGP